MTSKPPLTQPPGGANTLGLPSIDQDGQFYKSAVRFTRAYAMFSPTMVGLLLAKKTRFGRFIPLPDALPDGFRLGSLNGNETVDKTDGAAANGAVPHAENGKVAAPHSAFVAEKPGVNGTTPKVAVSQVVPAAGVAGTNGTSPKADVYKRQRLARPCSRNTA